MNHLDIAPFALPNHPKGELRFEDYRDIERVVVTFAKAAPKHCGLSYLQKTWPGQRYERAEGADMFKTAFWGWSRIDDLFTPDWKRAAVSVKRVNAKTLEMTFRGLHREFQKFPDYDDYNVNYRRTVGIRVDVTRDARISKVQVFTRSAPVRTRMRVCLDAGKRTRGKHMSASGYNARIAGLRAETGVSTTGRTLKLGASRSRVFTVTVDHMRQAFRYANDDGQVTFTLDHDTFTISLASLEEEGPVWFADEGIYITEATDETNFDAYRKRIRGAKTIAQHVVSRPEQSLGGAMRGQVRPHPVPYIFGWKYCREKFVMQPDGDLVMSNFPMGMIQGRDQKKLKNAGAGRVFFGLSHWILTGRTHDPFPMPAPVANFRDGSITLKQETFAIPLETPVDKVEMDAILVACMRFTFKNVGTKTTTAHLPLQYSARGSRIFWESEKGDPITYERGWIRTRLRRSQHIRAYSRTDMQVSQAKNDRLEFTRRLAPGASCKITLNIPFVAINTAEEKRNLVRLKFASAYKTARNFWEHMEPGASLKTPEPRLDELARGHVPIVMMADYGLNDGSGLVNTSVGNAAYLNYPNESCMILQDLNERGLMAEVRKRVAVWTRFQSTRPLIGRFTDQDGVFFGAGGAEQGQSYNQHHGWVLWMIAEHYFLTRDRAWLKEQAEALVKGIEWVTRQRKATLEVQRDSLGWERGFLPAGSLEDVDDFFYWLSTNCLTWRGVDSAARALAEIDHPDAGRFQREANAYRRDLIRGFELSRQHSPLVRLRNGRWIPHYPSRLYRRGRDYGWIREVLEGSVYLLISGLYSHNSKQARWILDDFQDTRYMNPPYGFPPRHEDRQPPILFEETPDPVAEWYHQGGYSVQPNLLAGLIPYLDRDEIEVYLWMFFNAWAVCYTEEGGSLFEHPMPFPGFANLASQKTSDQSNAVKWLRYLFVYAPRDKLYIGRAIPREWFESGKPMGVEGVVTRFGKVSASYAATHRTNKLSVDVTLKLHHEPARTLVRFRHPDAAPIRSVRVNGKVHRRFDAKKGDVDVTGMDGKLKIVAKY